MAINKNIGSGSGFRNPLEPGVLGCTDRFAINYNPKANISCDSPEYDNVDCCKYGKVGKPVGDLISDVIFIDDTPIKEDKPEVGLPISYPYDISTENPSCLLNTSGIEYEVLLKSLANDFRDVTPNWDGSGSINDISKALNIIREQRPDNGVYTNGVDSIPWIIPTYMEYTPLTRNEPNIDTFYGDCSSVGGEIFVYQEEPSDEDLVDKARVAEGVKEIRSLDNDIKKAKSSLESLKKKVSSKEESGGRVGNKECF